MICQFGLPILCIALFAQAAPDDPPAKKEPPRESRTTGTQEPGQDAKAKSKPQIGSDDASLLKMLEKQSAPSQPESNPLERIDHQMRHVQDRLAKLDSGDETQVIQNEIIKELEVLIDQAKKSSGNNSNKDQQKQKRQTSSKQPAAQPKPGTGTEPQDGATARPGEISNEQKAAGERIVRAIWGHLPDKMREEMQQASQDSGLPKYRSLIELYFRAIAEQSESRRQD